MHTVVFKSKFDLVGHLSEIVHFILMKLPHLLEPKGGEIEEGSFSYSRVIKIALTFISSYPLSSY